MFQTHPNVTYVENVRLNFDEFNVPQQQYQYINNINITNINCLSKQNFIAISFTIVQLGNLFHELDTQHVIVYNM